MADKNEQNANNAPSRRQFIKFLGASAIAASASTVLGCEPSNSRPADSNIHEGDVPKGKMTTRRDPKTGKDISLLGYGCMRFPTLPGSTRENPILDQEAINESIAYAMEHGVNLFDTSPRYCKGQSEAALGEALKPYPREKYYLSTKLSNQETRGREDSIEIYNNSFKYLNTSYIDYYLAHALGDMDTYKERYIDNGIMDFLQEERAKGKIKQLGWSFHGKKAFFDYMMHESNIRWDFVLIQLNYYDWLKADGKSDVNAQYLYEECVKYGVPVFIMEPLLGGRLAHPNFKAMEIMQRANPKASYASWAFRYVAGLENVLSILSGMTYMEHLRDNIRTFSPFVPLSTEENTVIREVVDSMLSFEEINCTHCDYCMPCPFGVDIPRIFAHYNKCLKENKFPINELDKNFAKARRAFLIEMDRQVAKERQPNRCIMCKKCVKKCPQEINIPQEMKKIDDFMEHLKKGMG